MSGPVVVVTGRHRPHELVLQAYAFFAGIAYLGGAPPPSPIVELMPRWVVHVWAAGLVLSGVLTAFSVAVRPVVPTLRLEQAAMLVGAAALVWLAYGIFVYAPPAGGLLSGGLCTAWCAANVIRAVQIHRDLKGIP